MKTITTDAIILRRINFGEADRILTILTSEHGKISVLAKGVRRSKSKLAGGLELFSVTKLSYIDGRSELKTVISTQLTEYFAGISKNIEATMCAYNFLKYVDSMTEHNCEPAFFDLLSIGFRALHQQDCEPSVIVSWFYSSLLGISGHGINLEHTARGEPFTEDKHYMFDFDAMGFVMHPDAAFSPKHIKLLRLFGKVSAPENLLHVDGAPQLAGELTPLLEKCLQLSK